MTTPFVIDNQQHKMADVLNDLLRHHKGHSLDVATAYFNVGGWQLLRDGLNGLGNVRLLLGDEPEDGSDLGLREIGAKPVKGLIRDLARENFSEATLRLVEDLIAFLRQGHVQVRLYKRGFLHAKCYLFYSGGGFERFTPVAAIVGSSNFTRPGLQTNKELNLAHRANLVAEEVEPDRVKAYLESTERKRLAQMGEAGRVTAANVPGVVAINELAAWYDRQWEAARDFKDDLIDLLDASKFGRKEYTPYQVYMKAIFEYFRDDLENGADTAASVRSIVELSEFQEDAVKKARKILASYDGVMVADSVGLGKTWIGKKLLEDYAYHQRYKALVICPAALQKMWRDELLSAGIAAHIITQEARQFIETLPTLNAELYDLKRLHNDLRRDVNALREIWHDIETITPANDAKLEKLKQLLAGELKGQKVLLFTYYKDSARYLYQQLCSDDPAASLWRTEAGDPYIRRMDSGIDTRERARLVAQFAPHANNKPEIAGSDKEIDIMISTDVLSEGQNLQDCGVLINYDLHWNPTRMVQRAGRIDRIGTSFETLWVLNMFPDEGLERLLGLVESLSRKIASIDQSGFLDASILGEIVHPQNFNTLRRIEEEDGKVVEEQEQFVELVSSEFLLQNLRNLLDDLMRRMLEDLPDGIHSGLLRQGANGVFFYFTAQRNVGTPLAGARPNTVAQPTREHYWRYIDLSDNKKGGRIEDNRYVITNLIQCQPDTPRVVPFETEVDIFALQEKVIASIVQSSADQVAVEEAPRLLDPIQQTIATTLRGYINSPAVSRKEIIAAIQVLNEPQPGVYIKTLRKAYEAFTTNSQIDDLLTAVKSIGTTIEPPDESNISNPESKSPVKREDLKLICFDYVWQ